MPTGGIQKNRSGVSVQSGGGFEKTHTHQNANEFASGRGDALKTGFLQLPDDIGGPKRSMRLKRGITVGIGRMRTL